VAVGLPDEDRELRDREPAQVPGREPGHHQPLHVQLRRRRRQQPPGPRARGDDHLLDPPAPLPGPHGHPVGVRFDAEHLVAADDPAAGSLTPQGRHGRRQLGPDEARLVVQDHRLAGSEPMLRVARLGLVGVQLVVRQVVGPDARPHAGQELAVRVTDHQTTGEGEQLPAAVALQRTPLALRREQQRHVLGALEVRGAEDPGLPAGAGAVVARRELLEPEHRGAAAGQLPAGHRTHRADPYDGDVGVHCISS
jgi:hypothetical protein